MISGIAVDWERDIYFYVAKADDVNTILILATKTVA
jgi:hypothetical protein